MDYPEFIKNTSFYALDVSRSAEDQLKGVVENVKKIHQLTNTPFSSFEDLIHKYIAAGLSIFKMETGIVSCIQENIYQVKAVVSPLDAIHAGSEFQLEDTYCREVYETRTVIGFSEIGCHAEMCKHPVYLNLKLEAYLSAPIWVGDELYGTLNFTSTKAREHGFSEHERDLIEMMAGSIGTYLLLQSKEERLIELNKRLKIFVGYVSHDLRNPLGFIKSAAAMGRKRIKSEEHDGSGKFFRKIEESADISLELVSTILDFAALGTGKIVPEIKAFNLSALIRQSMHFFQPLLDEKKCEVDLIIPDDGPCLAMGDENRLLQVFMNLFNNASKYCDESSRIQCSVSQDNDIYSIKITNKIKMHNRYDSDPKASTGFGLTIVQEILQAHNVTFSASVEKGMFSVSFFLLKAD
ncbi:GAF domain-containing sensor histidine kinase [Teredinibacter sp. KSP-S5-2]|uniref:GAF domain-containing sensor histidine kinase n=1 Tax=Teredinibacter sp. KSP-S5-2 TaxID=3034506 RepID=UPI002934C749|nr:GAF domain-containing sensor histidine kinase [Teredinibacter sp. KSP-S5-2]WNO08417.1 GAF domain-containing sensor histidine kinase [Teredinibacter sp. KSP-S5-2]